MPKRITPSETSRLLGARLRLRRRHLGESQAATAHRNGLDPVTISHLEHGKLEASLDELRTWFGFYSNLVVAPGGDSIYADCAHEFVLLDSPLDGLQVPAAAKRGVDIKVADSALHRARMEPMLVSLGAGRQTGTEPEKHLGEEIIFAIQGSVLIESRKPDEPLVATALPEGGLIHLDSGIPHRVVNESDEPALLLVIKSPPDRYSTCTLQEEVREIAKSEKS